MTKMQIRRSKAALPEQDHTKKQVKPGTQQQAASLALLDQFILLGRSPTQGNIAQVLKVKTGWDGEPLQSKTSHMLEGHPQHPHRLNTALEEPSEARPHLQAHTLSQQAPNRQEPAL